LDGGRLGISLSSSGTEVTEVAGVVPAVLPPCLLVPAVLPPCLLVPAVLPPCLLVLAVLPPCLLVPAVLPPCLLVLAVQMLVASFARSVKEAQTYLSLMVFVPMLPAMAASVEPFGSKLWMLPVPVLGQQALLMDLIRGQAITIGRFALAGGAATLAALLCVRATASLFRRERIIYGH